MPRHAANLADTTKYPPGRFVHLQPLHKTGKKKNGSVEWECRCTCGNLHKVTAQGLIRNDVRSCGKCGLIPRGEGMRKKCREKNGIVEAPVELVKAIPEQSALAKALNVRETKKEFRADPEIVKYENKPLTERWRKNRERTVNEMGIAEARLCGAGRFNFWW